MFNKIIEAGFCSHRFKFDLAKRLLAIGSESLIIAKNQ